MKKNYYSVDISKWIEYDKSRVEAPIYGLVAISLLWGVLIVLVIAFMWNIHI